MALTYLDANVLIHAFEGGRDDAAKPFADTIVRAAMADRLECVTSELTLAEVLAPARRAGASDPVLKRIYLNFLVWSRKVRLEPLLRADMYESAQLMASQKEKVGPPDRLHLAVAIRVGASHFVTNDKAIRTPKLMSKLRLIPADMHPFLAEVRP